MSLKPLFTTKDVSRWFDIFEEDAEDKLIKTLQYAGEYFVKTARKSGKYIDHTGNLRSSIGYVICNDGDIVIADFELSPKKGTDKGKGKREAEMLALAVAKTHNRGLVLIGVAGMKYAAYVEAIEGKDVISGAYIGTEDELRKILEKAFKRAKHYGR